MSETTIYTRAYKYRLNPNRTQLKRLAAAFAVGRHMYNEALHIRIQEWQRSRRTVNRYYFQRHFRDLRNEYPDDAGLVSSSTMQRLMMRLEQNYQAFFQRRGQGQGFPKFKNVHTFTGLPFTYGNGIKFLDDSKRLRVFKVGDIKVRYHRPLPEGCNIKAVVIKRVGRDKYDAVFQLEVEARPLPSDLKDGAVGIDAGLVYLLALSDGQTLENPRWYRESLAKRRRLNRALDHKTRYSIRWKRVKAQIARHERQIANRRHEFWHEVTDRLTRDHSFIVIEDITPGFMIANKHLALSAHDASWGKFRMMLEYKCAERGVTLVTVPPAYTSQTCSLCGVVDKGSRRTQADFVCTSCGHSENADINAARNILRRGISQVKMEQMKLAI